MIDKSVHPITCHVFFESVCPFLNSFQGQLLRWLCNKPSSASALDGVWAKLSMPQHGYRTNDASLILRYAPVALSTSLWQIAAALSQQGKGKLKRGRVVVLFLLTVRPSLFLPPREYRLPSLGSGKKAGLGFQLRQSRDEMGTINKYDKNK